MNTDNLDELVESIERAKGLLLKRIRDHGHEYYLQTIAKSPDNTLGLRAMGCFSRELQEVFVSVYTSQSHMGLIGRMVSGMAGLEKVPGKDEYQHGSEFSVTFGADHSVTIRYSQKEALTDRLYYKRVEMLVNWLSYSLVPGKRPAEELSAEETQKMQGRRIKDYKGPEDINPQDIYGRGGGIQFSGYYGVITIADAGKLKKLEMSINVGLEGISKEDMGICVSKLRAARYDASFGQDGLVVSQAFTSMPTNEHIQKLAETTNIILGLWGK